MIALRTVIGLLAATVVLPGCALLQQGGSGDDRQYDPAARMMTADIVPLAAGQEPYTEGRPMPVPTEPSPYEMRPGEKPAAMKSDLEPARPVTGIMETEPVEVLNEPTR